MSKPFLSVGHAEGCFAFCSFCEVDLPVSEVHVAGDEAVRIANFKDCIVTSGGGKGERASSGI